MNVGSLFTAITLYTQQDTGELPNSHVLENVVYIEKC